MNILILGDSWAADWQAHYDQYLGWPNILAEQHLVTNRAQAGVSQYSIIQQLKSESPADYDGVIISITSPYRLYTPRHPVHTEGLHKHSDLIYTDLEYHQSLQPDNPQLQSAIGFYQHHFDTEHAQYVHQLLVSETLKQLNPDTTVVTSNISGNNVYVPPGFTYCEGSEIYQSYPGKINHMNAEGNQLFANSIIQLME